MTGREFESHVGVKVLFFLLLQKCKYIFTLLPKKVAFTSHSIFESIHVFRMYRTRYVLSVYDNPSTESFL